ncbi:formimidoylglutamase [Echinicola jeungdonensis]|uniref:Formimidoylglutamase n=1 Tax=Echinicola jeungdonensis TaxID=709343 RepID=A0ABV5J6D8_9BACT|nr:formimidoylglutamase [Echinicola jeungdonensis]MDN3669824.1 formimidoylglutamase [Echinicola jeungdonensis]
MDFFKTYSEDDLPHIIRHRPNEIKLGEKMSVGWGDTPYVLIGIPESLGVKANGGIGGTESLWSSFLFSFLNIQSTEKLTGDEVSLLGYFDFESLTPDHEAPVEKYQKAVKKIDKAVQKVIRKVLAHGKFPIVIGGGHNNCYPLIKGMAEFRAKVQNEKDPAINVVNFDAHADFRKMDGRHSGNGFRYAYEEGCLHRYVMLGLSENYNGQEMLNDLIHHPDMAPIFWEDIELRKKLTFQEALERIQAFLADRPTGIELDLDAIENVLCSAMSPTGFSISQARQYVHHMASHLDTAYLHICEGAVELENGLMDQNTAHIVAFLVSDFIKARKVV